MKGFYLVTLPIADGFSRLDTAFDYISTTTWGDASPLDGVSGLGEWVRKAFEHFSPNSFDLVVLIENDNATEFFYMTENQTIKHIIDDDKKQFLNDLGLSAYPCEMEIYYKVMELLDDIAIDGIKYHLTIDQISPKLDTISQLISYSGEDEEDYISSIADANNCGEVKNLLGMVEALQANFLSGERVRVDGKPYKF